MRIFASDDSSIVKDNCGALDRFFHDGEIGEVDEDDEIRGKRRKMLHAMESMVSGERSR